MLVELVERRRAEREERRRAPSAPPTTRTGRASAAPAASRGISGSGLTIGIHTIERRHEQHRVQREVHEPRAQALVHDQRPVREHEHDVEDEQRGDEPRQRAHGAEQPPRARAPGAAATPGVPSSSSGATTIVKHEVLHHVDAEVVALGDVVDRVVGRQPHREHAERPARDLEAGDDRRARRRPARARAGRSRSRTRPRTARRAARRRDAPSSSGRRRAGISAPAQSASTPCSVASTTR